MPIEFNADRFKRFSEQYFPTTQQKEFDWIVQSIGKQHDLCEFHYDCFMEAFKNPNRKLARVNSADETRIEIEAHAFAFLMHLHALMDSFPYLLNELFPTEVSKKNLGWNKETLKAFEKLLNSRIFNQLNNFKELDQFQKLKNLVNEAKHSGLPKIRDSVNNLYIVNMEEKEEELKPFMEKTFDDLFTALFELLQNVIEAAEKQRENA